jgi:DivIVA domain-containing protein
VMSIFTRPTASAKFRLRWLGYDRAEVDEFLRQTQADRQRLQEDLAQLEAVMTNQGEERRREFERLSLLRIEVASCLETSVGALRAATERLSSTPLSTPAPRLVPEALKPAATWAPFRLKWPNLRGRRFGAALSGLSLQSMSGERRRALVAAGSAAVLILAVVTYQYQPRASERPAAAMAEAGHESSRPVLSPAPSGPPAPMIQQVEGLVLTLTARRTCWIGASIDGGQRLERGLKPDETIMLRADQEAVLRVGDAAALSVLINKQLAKPLGAAGQVVTARITRANYLSFLTDK